MSIDRRDETPPLLCMYTIRILFLWHTAAHAHARTLTVVLPLLASHSSWRKKKQEMKRETGCLNERPKPRGVGR